MVNFVSTEFPYIWSNIILGVFVRVFLGKNYIWIGEIQLCATLCDPMDYSLPGSSVHGTLRARILEWVAIPFSRESSQPKDWTQVSHIAGQFFITWATRVELVDWVSQIVFPNMGWPIQAVEGLNRTKNAYSSVNNRELFLHEYLR